MANSLRAWDSVIPESADLSEEVRDAIDQYCQAQFGAVLERLRGNNCNSTAKAASSGKIAGGKKPESTKILKEEEPLCDEVANAEIDFRGESTAGKTVYDTAEVRRAIADSSKFGPGVTGKELLHAIQQVNARDLKGGAQQVTGSLQGFAQSSNLYL